MLIILEKSLFLINDLLHHPAMFPNSCPRVLTILLLLLSMTCCSPGHLVHDYYKCQGEYFKKTFLICKEERKRKEEEEESKKTVCASSKQE